MKRTAAQKFRLGVFVIMGTLILVVALYFIGNRQNLLGSNIRLYAEFSNVNGLQAGNNVRYSGIDVGTVSRIRMTSDTLILVEMIVQESESQFIRKDAVATIGSDGLVGNMIINILPRPGNQESVVSGDTIATYSRIGTDDMLTTLNVTNENAALLTADLLKITTELLEGKGTLGMLINDTVMAAELKRTMIELRKASTGANRAIAELNQLVGSIKDNESVAGVLLTDSVSGAQMKRIISNLESTSEQIGIIGHNLDSIVSDFRSGEGAYQYLTQDPDAAMRIDSTLINIQQSSEKFNENMEAMRANFLFRGYFRKQEKEAEKARKKAARDQ
jgi:phospholipid/cholesterol/gamma-HCH transport system substrate-binding protein